MRYEDWLTEWLAYYVKPGSKQRTYEHYADIVRLHIIPLLGGYDINDLTPLVLQKFVLELTENGNLRTGEGLSAGSIRSVVSVVQSSLKTAHMLGVATTYTAGKIKCPKSAEKHVESFAANEQKKIEKYILGCSRLKLKGIVICLYTGLRLGELLALTWDDVDFCKGRLSVNKTCHDGRVNGVRQHITDTPKTENSRRVIPLPKSVLAILREMRKASKSEYVIEDNKGRPVYLRSYQRAFELLLKKLNIPHKGFHALRHTFATRAIECGMDVKSLSEILGHKNATITLNRYAHSLWEHKSAMMDRLGKNL